MIHRPEQFASIPLETDPSVGVAVPGLTEAVLLLDKHRKNIPFEGVYFGSEFCERLIPRPQELETALDEVRERDLSLVLLSPYLTDAGIEKMSPLLELVSTYEKCEVVLNDWGMIRYTRRNFPRVVPVVGRLLSRMMKEVRITNFLKPDRAPPGALRVLRDCGYSNSDYNKLLSQNGIERIELDIPPQGLGVHPARGMKMSVHVPFGYVCTGRSCMPGSLNVRPDQKFTSYTPCRIECIRWILTLRQKQRLSSGDDPFLLQRGNTVFYLEERSLIEEALTQSDGNGMDRVVVDTNLLS